MKKIIGIMLSLAIMMGGALPALLVSAEENTVNLASGTSVTLIGHNSGNYDGKKEASTAKLTDGDIDNDDSVSGFWQNDARVDLGSVKKISKVMLYRKLWHSQAALTGHTVNISVRISEDGEEWTNLNTMAIETLSSTDTSKTQLLTINVSNKAARYIELADIDEHNGTQNQMQEIIVVPGWENLAEGKSVTRTGYQYDGSGQKSNITTEISTAMTDGDITNYTGMSGAFHIDIETDLGEIKSIKSATLYRKMTYYSGGIVNDAQVRLEISEDGESWTPVGIMTKQGENASADNTKTEQVLSLTFASVRARYVRFTEINNHNGVAPSPSEIILTEARNNVAAGGSVTFYDVNNNATNNTDTAKVIDGNYDTKASGNGAWAYHTVLQLNKKYVADTIRVVFGNDNADSIIFKAFVSSDGTSFKPVGILTKTADRTFEASFEPQVVKAIKVFDITGNRAEKQCSISEIEVYEADTSYAVAYLYDGSAAETLKDGVASAEVVSGKLADSVAITAFYNSLGEMLSCNTAKLIDGKAITEISTDGITPRTNIAEGKAAYLRNVDNTADQAPNGSVAGIKYANYLTDGDAATFALGSGEYTGMMKVDLGQDYPIGEIIVDFINASDKYEIAVSTDDQSYTTLYTETDKTGGEKHYKVNGQKARYVGIFNKTTQNIQHRIAEIKVYQPTTERFSLRTFVWNSFDGEKGIVPLGDVAEITN